MNVITWINSLRRVSRARKWQWTVAAGLMAYPLVSTALAFSVTGPTTHPSREVFPFFTWSLYSRVMDVRYDYEINILKVDGQPFDGKDATDVDDVLTPFGKSTLGYKALQNVGKALRRKEKGAKQERQAFERRYFSEKDVRYEILRKAYNPLERWRDRSTYDRLQTVGEYNVRGRP